MIAAMAVVFIFHIAFILLLNLNFNSFDENFQKFEAWLRSGPKSSFFAEEFEEFDLYYRHSTTFSDTTRPHWPSYLVSCCLYQPRTTLLWSRPLHTVPYKPRPHRSLLSTLVALILLSGDVELNPGPPTPYITFASLNIRSVKSKVALVHDIINDNNIDLLALQETWLSSETHPAIKLDLAPPGFTVHHVHRPIVAGGKTRGGGLAVVSTDSLKARPFNLHYQPTTFEIQTVQFNTSPSILLLNIYQPSSPPPAAFFDELGELLACAAVESSASLVLCGDLNCSGDDGQSVGAALEEVLVSGGLEQHVRQPTRGANLLDIVASSDPGIVRDVNVVDCDCVSDHRLVTARIQSRRSPSPTVQTTYRNLKRLNLHDFEAALRRSALFVSPADTVDSYAGQLRTVITEQLNKFAPLRTVRKRMPKTSMALG